MKLVIVVVLGLLIATRLQAAEPDTDSCVNWNNFSVPMKHGIMFGFLIGIQASDAVNRKIGSDGTARQLWPQGYRVGGVVLEMDTRCAERDNRDRTITEVMFMIAMELNDKR